MALVENQRGLTGHAKRGRVDDQIEAAFAVIEGKVGGICEVGDIDRVVFATRVEFVERSEERRVGKEWRSRWMAQR